ncbi:MAG: outer membrane protein assembly factor BamA [Gammaproteobacteria bacterium]|nr:outer membrane protein assembly factor BamA [Gammaproteobacteria bacterium]
MKKITIAFLLIILSRFVYAAESFVISDIRIEGIERLDAGTVFNYLPLKVGDTLDDEEVRLSTKKLFSTGFFKDVTLERDGTALIVNVVERPSIAFITVNGNDELDDDGIESGLDQAGLVQGRIFNKAEMEKVKQEIKEAYLSLGRYSATVESVIEDLNDNRVAITININEGRVARIKKINIIGAESVSIKDLKDEMRLKDDRGFRLFSRKDQYSKQKLEADVESIRSYYLDRGYHEFKVTSTNVEISPNKQNVFISISLEEGNLFTFGDTTIEGIDKLEGEGLLKLVTIEQGKPFSRKAVSQSRAAIAERYADDGYAFVEIRPVFQTRDGSNVVDTVFAVTPNQRVYVRRIDITGNLHTRDEVIRRELRQFEGSWFSASALQRSRDRLQRLGFFESVNIETPPVPGTTDQVDMNVVIRERDTGSVQFSVGYSDADGALIGAGYQQRNLLGTGKDLQVDVNTSKSSQTASVSYTNPYHTLDGVSRTIRLTSRKLDASEANTAEYLLNTNAAGVVYRIPIAETNSFNLGISYEQIDLQSTDETPPEILSAIEQRPKGDNAVLTMGVSKDTRDDFFFPTRGATGNVSLEATVPGSEFEYYKLNLQGAVYVPVSQLLTVKAGLGFGQGEGYGDQSELGLPFFKNYYAGGANSVRGFKGRSLGPRDTGDSPQTLGGDKRVLANLELLFPPYGEGDGNDKRIGIFFDGGMVYGNTEELDLGKMRYSAGLVYNWFSPIGPFSISYAVPMSEEIGDDKEELQISFGSVFR